MSAVRITAPLAAVRTGARWEQDFVFLLQDLTPRQDLAGKTPRLALKPVDPRRRDESFTLDGAAVVLWPEEGRIGIRCGTTQTAAFAVGQFGFEVQLVDGAGEVDVLAEGRVLLKRAMSLVPDVSPLVDTLGKAGTVVVIAETGQFEISGVGPKGDRGARILGGEGAPAADFGAVDDCYLDRAGVVLYGPKTDEGWSEGLPLVGPPGPDKAQDISYDPVASGLPATTAQEALDALKAEHDALVASLPVLGAVRLTNLLYVYTAAADTFISDVLDVMDGGVPRVYPNDGRFKITGNAIDGYRLLKGPSATSVGAQSVTVRVSNPAARNGPHHDTVFALQAMAADRYMVGLTRIRPNSGNNLVAAAGTERKMSVFVYGAPQFMTNRYRFHFSGFASTEGGNSPQETVLPGNDTVIHGVWAIIGAAIVNGAVLGGVRYRLTFGGANGVTIASGANGPWTDEANFLSNVPKEGHVAVVTEYSTAAGQNQIPNARIQKHRGERIWGAAAGVSLEAMLDNLAAPSTAALDTTYGLVTQPQFYGPDNAAFKGWEGKPVALVMADSIGESRQEYSGSADARGNLGVLRRWLDADDATHHRTPHYMIGMPGAGSQRELTTNALKRWDNLDQLTTWNGGLPPFTVVLDQLAQNDLNATFANMLANHKGAVTRVKARYPGVKVVAWGVLPRSTSTDYYATRANQTRASGNEWATPTDTWGNGFKWQLEAAREALLDGELSAYISTKPAWYDASYPGAWAPATVTSLAQPAGTDGVATYSQVVLTQMPYVSDVVRWGGAFAGVGIVTDVAANPGGGWLATLDRNTNTVVAAAGSAVLIPPTNDGVHPQPTEVVREVSAIPQSEKAKLAA
ncbi:hypothetical protein V7S57_02500 [Caulobacter sp. CCNWLY153]|uniref:hypothetical protein n=1 Tax=unclassified Caulobacter TaxID=2648921 RepID=UPI002FF3D08D